jgi:hypothetical protein
MEATKCFFLTKFNSSCLGKRLNRVKLHVHNSPKKFQINYSMKHNLCCKLKIKKISPDRELNAVPWNGSRHRYPFGYHNNVFCD